MKIIEFISKFNEEEVIQKMQSVKSPEEAYAVAKDYGVTDSLEEFVEEMTRFKTAIDELSEEDLEAVAGGLSQKEKDDIISVIEISVSTVTAVATVSALSAASAAL
ncbi:MAG: hypothetical protein PHE79_10745 [Eubacteriales bacterium]|nr:hypothetical protein [Eubacteriales bacterium]